MENKGRRISSFSNLMPPLQQFGSHVVKLFYDEEFSKSFIDEQSKAEEYFKRKEKKTTKVVDLSLDSDEEFKPELEYAVKQYKKNIKKKEQKSDSVLYNEKSKYENKKSQNPNAVINRSNDNQKEKISGELKSNGSASDMKDVQELINYFFLNKREKSEKSTKESYIDYKKKGAIPKRLQSKEDSRGLDRSKLKTENIEENLKKNKNAEKRENINKFFFCNDQRKIQENLNDNALLKNSDSDDVVKIIQQNCSEPFFYIVPENPSPNFFLPRGSYYVIPKTPDTLSEERIFFHPEKRIDECLQEGNSEIKFCGVLNSKEKDEQKLLVQMNNLGKEVPQKMDSHLNIGPVDVKLSDTSNNLETNYDSDKVFNKSLVVCNSSNASGDEAAALVAQTEVENSGEEVGKNPETLKTRELDNVLQTLLSEFPNLGTDPAQIIAEEYLFDEDGLNNYIKSARLEEKMKYQLEKMILALPESNLNELRAKCIEFQGEEDLVDNYIQETLQANRIRQQLLDIQYVIPDADPNFLLKEIEKLNGDEQAFNKLTDQLLDSENYPKIPVEPLDEERRRLWRMYVENFNVKQFVLKVPNPNDFKGKTGDNNKADPELIIKFLQSRFPSLDRNYLLETFTAHCKNVTKTCEFLKKIKFVRLSESSFRNEAFSEDFLVEICYIDHEKEINDYLKEMKERMEIEREEARLNNSFLSCPLCLNDEVIASEAVCCLEGHLFCKECIKRYIIVKISEGVFKFDCPSMSCDTFFSYGSLESMLSENMLSKIINKQQAEEISRAEVDGLESCPYCDFAYIPNPEDKIFRCQNRACMIETCRMCREKNHIPLRCEEIERSVDVEARKKIEESMSQKLIRVCPKCQKKIVKIDGCNKVVCVCGTMICYFCRQLITDYSHFSKVGSNQKCPLYSNNEVLHTAEVYEAGIRTREEILQTNRNIRLLHDPTKK